MKIYGIHIQTVEHIPCEHLKALFPKRYAKAQRFLRREDRLRCLGAGYLIHHVLAIAEDELQYGEYGKPFAPGRKEFSLSHGGNWAILAADDHPVGVDIEPLNVANLDVAGRVFTANELLWMQPGSLERFHVLWTIKESVMKATGQGMQLDPAGFEVLPIGGPNFIAGETWHAAWMLWDRCAIACASAQPISDIIFEEIISKKEGRYV